MKVITNIINTVKLWFTPEPVSIGQDPTFEEEQVPSSEAPKDGANESSAAPKSTQEEEEEDYSSRLGDEVNTAEGSTKRYPNSAERRQIIHTANCVTMNTVAVETAGAFY